MTLKLMGQLFREGKKQNGRARRIHINKCHEVIFRAMKYYL